MYVYIYIAAHVSKQHPEIRTATQSWIDTWLWLDSIDAALDSRHQIPHQPHQINIARSNVALESFRQATSQRAKTIRNTEISGLLIHRKLRIQLIIQYTNRYIYIIYLYIFINYTKKYHVYSIYRKLIYNIYIFYCTNAIIADPVVSCLSVSVSVCILRLQAAAGLVPALTLDSIWPAAKAGN